MTIEVNGSEIWVRCGSGDGSLMSIGTQREDCNFSINIVDEVSEMTVLIVPGSEMLMLAKLLEFQARKLLDAEVVT